MKKSGRKPDDKARPALAEIFGLDSTAVARGGRAMEIAVRKGRACRLSCIINYNLSCTRRVEIPDSREFTERSWGHRK